MGCDPGASRYCPNDLVKRDQMASFLARAVGLSPLPVSERPSFTVAFSGDILLHMPVNYAAASYGRQSGMAYDFSPMFAAVSPSSPRLTWRSATLRFRYIPTRSTSRATQPFRAPQKSQMP